MAPRKKKAPTKPKAETKKISKNGGVTKRPKPNKLTDVLKNDIKNNAAIPTPTPTSTKKTANKKALSSVDAYVLFEVCKSCHTYKRNANQIFNELIELFPKKTFELVINEHGISRRGSFEISVSKKMGNTSNSTLIWSGIQKGPPRRLKFPETSAIVDLFTKAIS